MGFFETILLGIVQGLTEFLPVSSSGHLLMAQTFLQDSLVPGIFIEVLLHVATLLAVVIVYHRRLARLAVGAVRGERESWSFIGLLALASLPAAVVGVFFRDLILVVFETPAITGVMLLVTGALLWSTRYLPRDVSQGEKLATPHWALALAIGCAQALAILPGISRSGATIVAGLWGGLRGDRAVEFSFLLAVPAIAGAGFLEFLEMNGSEAYAVSGLVAGFLAAFVSGTFAIFALIWLVRRQVFHAFAYYVWPVGILFLLYLWIQP